MARNPRIVIEVAGDSRSAERMFGRLDKKSSGLTSSLKSLGKVGFLGAGAAVVGFTALIKNGFDELGEAQKVGNQTNAVLKSTGAVANVSAKQVGALADSLSKMSGVDDELIQHSENLLLTFKNVRNEVGKGNKIFTRATKAALNLSSAGFGSIESTAKMMGKALNDPIKGMTALGRAGVTFTEAQKDQIEALVEANDLLGAQKIILREVESQVGGAARAAGDTFPGQLNKLRNAFDGITAALAKGMLPIVRKVAKDLTEKLADPQFMARVEKFGKILAEGVLKAFTAIGNWFSANWDTIKNAISTTVQIVKNLADALRSTEGQMAALAAAALLLTKRLRLLIGHPWVIAISLVILNKDQIDSWVKSKLGRFYGGNQDFDPNDRGDWMSLPKDIREKLLEQGFKPPKAGGEGPGKLQPRAEGGPVTRGMGYLVGESGPEMFVPGSSGHVFANGSGVHIGTVVLPGVSNAHQFLNELQRISRNTAGSRSGPFAGQSLTIG